MKLGVELLASRATDLRLGTFFETWIASVDGTIRRSVGRDEYHLGIIISADKRLAATGRTHICQLDLEAAEMGENQARPAGLAPAEDLPPGAPVLWGIRTNRFLTLADLVEGTTARLLQDDSLPVEFRLDHHLAAATEVAPGRYILDISNLLFS